MQISAPCTTYGPKMAKNETVVSIRIENEKGKINENQKEIFLYNSSGAGFELVTSGLWAREN